VHTLADGTPAMARNGGDGRGIDSFADWLPTLIEIYLRALDQSRRLLPALTVGIPNGLETRTS
jgi:hypothetical protein